MMGLRIPWILLNPSSFPLGKVHWGPNLDSRHLNVPYRQETGGRVRSIVTCSRGNDDPSNSNELLLHLVLNVDSNFIELVNRHLAFYLKMDFTLYVGTSSPEQNVIDSKP